MTILGIAASVLLLGLIALLAYWQLVVAEGAYLGQWIVTLLYDWFAPRYDRVKQFDPAYDAMTLFVPIQEHLAGSDPLRIRILDVATGTGRLPQALFAQPSFKGTIAAVDASRRMLGVARTNLAHVESGRSELLVMDALHLQFADATFDVVTCLEALEFMPDARRAIFEMTRVLKPGGLLMFTNRIGSDAWKLPGRTQSTPSFAAELTARGLQSVVQQVWMTDYDLVTAKKSTDVTS